MGKEGACAEYQMQGLPTISLSSVFARDAAGDVFSGNTLGWGFGACIRASPVGFQCSSVVPLGWIYTAEDPDL